MDLESIETVSPINPKEFPMHRNAKSLPRPFFLLIFVFFMSPSFLFAEEAPDQELLVMVPEGVARGLESKTDVRFYHRLPGWYIAGMSHKTFKLLATASVTLLDDRPWSGEYAVVSPLPGKRQYEDYSQLGVHLLARVDDLDIVRGSAHAFEDLRKRGFSCAEIQRRTIPLSTSSIHIPERIANSPTDEIIRIIGAVSDSSISAYIQGMQNFGTRYCLNANRDSVFRWVRQQFLQAGLANVVFDSFQYNSTWQKNVIATIPGTANPSAEIIVGGHFDSYSSNLSQAPGADDNASGTTAALEMARVLLQENYQPRLTLRFIGFAAEEAGLKGSADYALKARQQNRDIKVMMNYDMIGYRNQGSSDRDFYIVWYPGSEAFSTLHARTATSYTGLNPVFTTSYRSSSDSWSFYQQNYSTLFCIERDFNPYYHTPNDVLQYLDIPYTSDIIKAGLAMLLTLDALPPSITGISVRDRGDGSSLVVEWDSVTVADWYRYKVYVGTQPGIYTSNYLQTTRERMISGLTTGTRYYIGVSIIDLVGNESLITEVSETPLLVPRPPASVEAENIAQAVRISWEENTEIDVRGYNIFRSVAPETTFTMLNSQPFPLPVWIDSPLAAGTYSYFVQAVDSSNNVSLPSDTVVGSPIVGVTQSDAALPSDISLHANFPNPFNPFTTIQFDLPQASRVTLKIFDLIGREIATLLDETRTAGTHTVHWNAKDAASGVYYAVLNVGPNIRKHRMVLLK